MYRIEDFRTGTVSVPLADLDEVPSCCRECRYLVTKGFSVGLMDSLYVYCGLIGPVDPGAAPPACATG